MDVFDRYRPSGELYIGLRDYYDPVRGVYRSLDTGIHGNISDHTNLFILLKQIRKAIFMQAVFIMNFTERNTILPNGSC